MADEPKPSPEERISALMAPDPPTPEPRRRQAAQEPQEAPDEAEGEEPEQASAEPEAPDEAQDAQEGDGDEQVIELSDLDGLAEHLGTDVASLYDITVPVTINGKKQNVRLGDWKDSYVATTEASKAREEAKAMREEIARQAESAQNQNAARIAEAGAVLQALEAQAVERFKSVPWDELRTNDPSEWAAKRRELDEAKNQLEGAKQRVRQQLADYQQQMTASQKTNIEARLEKERAALYSAWPEMGDAVKGESERTRLRGFLKSTGFADQEIDNAADHRLLLLARDAMRYRESIGKADAAKKKVVKIASKVLKPGAKQSRAEQQSDANRDLRAKLRKSGHVNDAAALISKL